MRLLGYICVLIIAFCIRYGSYHTRTYFNNCDEFISVTTASGLVYRNIPLNSEFQVNEVLNRDIGTLLKDCAFGGYGGDNGNCYFYNFVNSLWVQLFGISDVAFRLFSTVCDLISIILLFLIAGKFKFSFPAAILCGLFFAVNPVFLTFGGAFIRTYSFATTLTLFSFLLYLKAWYNPSVYKSYVYFAIVLMLVFFSHFLSYYIFMAYGAFALFKRKKSPVFFKRVVRSLVGVVLVSAIILSFNKEGFADMKKRNEDLKKNAASSLMNDTPKFSAKTITLATFQYFISYYTGNFSLTGFAKGLGLKIIPLVFFILFLFFPLALFLIHFKDFKQDDPALLLWIMVLAGNISALGIMLVSRHFTSLDIRYGMFTVPFFFLLMARINYKNKRHLILPLMYGCIMIIGLVGTYSRYAPKEIEFEMGGTASPYRVINLSGLKKDFLNALKELKATDVIKFNNADDFIFFTLLTHGEQNYTCIINDKFSKGFSVNDSTLLSYRYYGAN